MLLLLLSIQLFDALLSKNLLSLGIIAARVYPNKSPKSLMWVLRHTMHTYIYTICICRFVADIDEMGFYWLRHATHVGVGYILCNCCCLPQFERHCKWSWKKTKSERSARNESTNWKTIAYQAPLCIKYINSVNYYLISRQLALKGNFCLFSILFLSLFFTCFYA